MGGLKQNYLPYHNSLPSVIQSYWFKKTKKEILRDSADINPLRLAISNSLHFICCGLSIKRLPF